MRRKLSLTFACLIAFTSPVLAFCMPDDFDRALARADAVFSGIVRSISCEVAQLPERGQFVVTIDVEKSWKRTSGTAIVLHLDHLGIGCDRYRLQIGKRYLVYASAFGAPLEGIDGAWRTERRFEIEYCSRTTELEYADDDLLSLEARERAGLIE